MEIHRLVIYRTDAHFQTVAKSQDGETVWQNDHSVDNAVRLAEALGIEVTFVKLTAEQFEEKFA